MDSIISVENISKRYKNTDFQALDNLSLSVKKGEIFGLLGPNGAGKTSLISVLTGLIKPDKGTFFIDGDEFSRNKDKIRRIIGMVPQEYALYPNLTARENLLFFGSMYGLKKDELVERIDSGIQKMGLKKFENKRIDTYSGGMKRRINLLAGVLHRPKVLFLDEPTVGVDVQSKHAIINFLRDLNESGATIVYSSHLLNEAQTFCTRVAIIDSGKIVLEGDTADVINKSGDIKSLEEVFIEATGNELRDNV
ncbi:MAG: ABC transporter ATP-binding protein [Brumimicrobium sp.]